MMHAGQSHTQRIGGNATQPNTEILNEEEIDVPPATFQPPLKLYYLRFGDSEGKGISHCH